MDERRRRFEALMLPHLDAAYNLARWLTRNVHDADDIVQDAYLRAYRSFDGFRGEDAKPWLLAIVRNCHRSARERARAMIAVPLAADDGTGPDRDEAAGWPASAVEDPEAQAMRTDAARALAGLLAALPETYREVLVLREFEELSYREIASIIDSPIGTVMSRLARARAMLREHWLAAHGDGT